jgi:hypothetical protein
MSRRFNFNQSVKMLHTNAKTFLKWLAEDGIDASKQIDPADPRQKYVTEEQIIAMAKKRDIELHLPDPNQNPESTAIRILAAIDEHFATLEQQMVELAGKLETQLHTTNAAIADLQHDLHTLMKSVSTVSPPREQVIATPKLTPTRTAVRRPAKWKVKSKVLPRNLVPLSAFRNEHGISNKAVEYALEKQKITIERGKWVHNNKGVILALTPQG